MSLHNKINQINKLQSISINASKNEDEHPSWVVYFLILIGGFVANVTFLVFLFLITEFKNPNLLLVTSIVLLLLTAIINKVTNSKIIQTFLTTTFLTGVSCFLAYLILQKTNVLNIYIYLALINLIAFYYLSSALIKLLAAIGFIASIILFFAEIISFSVFNYLNLLLLFLLLFIYKSEGYWFGSNKLRFYYQPVLLAIQFYLLFSYQFQKIAIGFKSNASILDFNINQSAIAIVLVVVLYYLLYKQIITQTTFRPFTVVCYALPFIIFTLLGFKEPYLLYGLLYILVAYKYKDLLFFASSALFFILFLGFWYYDLQTTLLNKSILLMFSGLLLLIQYLLLKLIIKNEKK